MFFSGYPKMVGLSFFPNLTQLILVGQNIQCIFGLESCPLLKELWIVECHLTTIEGLQYCPDLQKLYLYHNKISVISGLDNLLKLEVLWLNNNEIEVIEGLDMLLDLKEINLAANRIRSVGESLDPNERLERINLSGNKICSFKEIANLARLANLKDLGLKDPQYGPNPVCLLCNYAIHVLYHIPQLQRLDTNDVSEKQIKNLAECTVIKKIMYYNMRMKNLQRRQTEELTKVKEKTSREKQVPEDQIKALSFSVKTLEHELLDLRLLCNFQANPPASNICNGNQCGTEKFDSQPMAESRNSNVIQLELIHQKISALKERIMFWTQRISEIEKEHEKNSLMVKDSFDVLVHCLQTELETVGNVRFEEGNSSDSWFKSCYDLIVSRFCAMNFRTFGITGIKINRIVRVYNRVLRLQFEEKVQDYMDNEEMWTSEDYKKKLEYHFYMFDNRIPVEKKELLQILEDGFRISNTSLLPDEDRDEAVLLTNSLSLCEVPRLQFLQKHENSKMCNPELFKYGKLVIAKVFLGQSIQAHDKLRIKQINYPRANSVFRLQDYDSSSNEDICLSKDHGNCDCSLRQRQWFVFDDELVLPEYFVEFEYLTLDNCLLFDLPYTESNKDLSNELKLDKETLALEPFLKPKPKIISLDEKTILSVAKANIFSQITVLNLHGNSLRKLKDISRLNGLRKLIISFNDFSTLEDVSYLSNLEYLDASHNQIVSLEGFKGLGKLKHLDLSWNKLTNTLEDLNILRKQAAQLSSLDIQNNPWQKPTSVHRAAIRRLSSLMLLDGVAITEDQCSKALQFSGSKQDLLLTNARTDTVKPRCLSLLPTAQILTYISKNCLDPNDGLHNICYNMITSLNLDTQNLFKIPNLEKMVNLRWASFSNNNLTKIEGLEHCTNVEELCLDGNSITKLEGISKLTKLRWLSINNNQLIGFDKQTIEKRLQVNRTLLKQHNIGNNQEIYYLKGLSNLVIMDMWGNPILVKNENYRLFVIFHLHALKALDGAAVDQSESDNANDMFGGRLTSDLITEKLGHQRFTELQDLNWRSSSIRSVDLTPADQFINIHTVNLENNNLTSFSGLIFLPNVKKLYLNHNVIVSVLPQPKSQSHLTNRQILHQKVSSSGYGKQGSPKGNRETVIGESLSPIMPSLEVLHLGYNGISCLPSLQLARLRNLKSLYLQGNEIGQVEGLENLQFLRELVLDHNRIKVITETSFAKLHHLVSLNLEGNRLRELNNLHPLLNLKRLLVGFNKIQDIAETEKLEAFPRLVELSISGNPISRKMFLRQLLVFRLQNLQILDGAPVTAEERAKSEMYFLEQQALPVPNPGMELVNPVTTTIMYRPSPLRVTNLSLLGGIHQSLGADLHANNAQENIKYKKWKNPTVGAGNVTQMPQTDLTLKPLRGGVNIPTSYVNSHNVQSRIQ
ncbi:hypothetical protein GDO86_000189 [Hymenochirus boettgeri]|uniref:Leucine-rich repeat-containing protein 9 n=1 Tax=Hymenochirus boettgeri TaxID=247094 RepID=A0A8T2KB12_9PIPI|nr:hypothetical protein GDO86_000189 [Hymenochirus boettgeri]